MKIKKLLEEESNLPAVIERPEETLAVRRKRARIIKLIELMSNVESAYTFPQIAEEMGCSVRTLHNLINDPMYPKLLQEQMVDVGSNTQRALMGRQELDRVALVALRTLTTVMQNERAPATARVAAANAVLAMSGIKDASTESQREDDLRTYLEGLLKAENPTQINLTQINVSTMINASTPADYLATLDAEQVAPPARDADIEDAEIVNSD